jgi:hypothetical protein
MHWTATEYATFLKAFYEGKLFSAGFITEILQDHIVDVAIANSPVLSNMGENWHYGFGFWLECPDANYTCTGITRISSPGAYGAYPFIDYTSKYYGILARRGALGTYPEGIRVFRTVEDDINKWASQKCR